MVGACSGHESRGDVHFSEKDPVVGIRLYGSQFFKKNWLLVQVLLLGFVGIGRSDVGLQRLPPPEALGGG